MKGKGFELLPLFFIIHLNLLKMARVQYGSLVTKISGSVGGSTFQSNAYGFTVKNKPNMVKPNSVKQGLSKIILSKAVKGWSSITQVQRDTWDTFAATFPQFAKHNPSAQLSGFAAFVKYHTTMFLGQGVGIALEPSPVVVMPALDTAVLTLTNAAGVLTFTATWSLSTADWLVNYYISRPFLPSQNFVGSATRFLYGGSSDTDPNIITALYLNLFGRIPAIGEIVIIEYEMFNQGGGKVLARFTDRVVIS